MDITISGVIIAIALLLVPIAIILRFKIPIAEQAMTTVVRVAIQLTLVCAYIFYLYEWNSTWVNLLWLVLMGGATAYALTARSKLKLMPMLIPVVTGVLVAAFVVGMIVLWPVMRLGNPFETRFFLPIMAMLLASILDVCAVGLRHYYHTANERQQQYYYMLGNSATRTEAITPFLREAFVKAFTPQLANLSMLGMITLPLLLTSLLLGGWQPLQAVKMVLVIICATLAASSLALLITLFVSNTYLFDKHNRMKNVLQSQTPKEE
ncbi:MAG: ABC transporter permease [Prevotella sp.]|nr:ABC transporter permease [Prevotella sp.]